MRYKTSFSLDESIKKQISALQASEQLEQQKTITKSEVVEKAIQELYDRRFKDK